ncbi:winged helix-turn-helix domain-containing protein [Streptomyces beihaiensis]|uniref:Winged helix-turn-helix domain-containing protein n=1 Tax=Streptomyces beihaiensis TaxID=2984495 RepID=A0ABT3TRR4_9ACTN|nr:winged helix-turn-helix domain-containing protein [Streptomyces beihaiensis]MCX3059097.1 winged helix-turn-helix domain-containing protein [Streptomyces beihaiensis]
MVNDEADSTSAFTAETIADELRRRIRSGALRPGERLPTQYALSKEFGVERGAVRSALQRLRSDGLLTNVTRGRPPEVAGHGAPEPAPAARPARSILGPRLVAAFDQREVRLDVACLTAETLMVSLGEPLRRVYDGSSRPHSLHVRVLLPRADQHLDYPAPDQGWGQDAKTDAAVHERNVRQMHAQRTVLEHNFNGLRRIGGIDVRVEFRELNGTPTRKVYLLNRREALIGHYIPHTVLRELDDYEGDNPVSLCDVEGISTPMFAFDTDGDALEAEFVAAEQLMFDQVWEHVARAVPRA